MAGAGKAPQSALPLLQSPAVLPSATPPETQRIRYGVVTPGCQAALGCGGRDSDNQKTPQTVVSSLQGVQSSGQMTGQLQPLQQNGASASPPAQLVIYYVIMFSQ